MHLGILNQEFLVRDASLVSSSYSDLSDVSSLAHLIDICDIDGLHNEVHMPAV